MLTGPVTILAWSFVRDDQPLGETANQVALALRDEIADLEAAGIRSSRSTSPRCASSCRCARPTRPRTWTGRSKSFRLATAGAADATQIHTHLCYSEFGEIIDAIDGLDADVTSIEAARSRMEVVARPRVPRLRPRRRSRASTTSTRRASRATQEVAELLEHRRQAVPSRQLWVNPDCGLKTRGYAETEESLRNLVTATRTVRAELLEAAK